MKINTDWIFKNLSISQLDYFNNTFNWFPGGLPECYRSSIEEDGIRLPLLVQSMEGSKFKLIDGFKRLSWLKSMQGESVEEYQQEQLPCLIIPKLVCFRDVTKIRMDTLSIDKTSFSGIHLCKVLNMLYEEGFSKNEIAFRIFPSLGLISSVRLVGQLMDLHKKLVKYELNAETLFPESMMTMGHEDLLPLLKFSSSDFPSILRISEKIKVKGKKWRNLLQVMDEEIRLRQTTAVKLLQYPEIQKILEDSNLQGPVRYRLLKQKLENMRFPELSKMRKRFDQKSKSLKLPERISLESDLYFEKDELALKMKFSSLDELRGHLIDLSDKVNSEKLKQSWNHLFDILTE